MWVGFGVGVGVVVVLVSVRCDGLTALWFGCSCVETTRHVIVLTNIRTDAYMPRCRFTTAPVLLTCSVLT